MIGVVALVALGEGRIDAPDGAILKLDPVTMGARVAPDAE